MRWVHALGAAVAATTLVGSTAKAVLSMSLVPVNNSSQAGNISSTDPVRTYDLQVTQTGTEKFNVANLQVTLASGSGLSGYFYASPGHNDTNAINQDPTGIANPLNVYDTYVTTPAVDDDVTQIGNHLAVTGSADWPAGPGSPTAVVPTKAGNVAGQNQTLNIVWGDQQAAQNTTTAKTYTIAQFTVVGNTGAYIRGYFGENIANVAQYFPPNVAGQVSGAALPQGTVYLPILGDIDLDGNVGLGDVTAVLNSLNRDAGGDTNGDASTDLADVTNLLNTLGHNMPTPPASGVALGSVVPEPTSLALLILSGVALTARKRRSL